MISDYYKPESVDGSQTGQGSMYCESSDTKWNNHTADAWERFAEYAVQTSNSLNPGYHPDYTDAFNAPTSNVLKVKCAHAR